jgi:hypothetical protein
MEKHNGWNNRETWVVNLWHGDFLQQLTNDYVQTDSNIETSDIAEYLCNTIEEYYEDEINDMSGMLRDMMYLNSVDWYELAKNYEEEARQNIKEETEE